MSSGAALPRVALPRVALEPDDVRAKFDRIKEFSPALARNTRRDLRRSGDEIIAEQRAILSGPLPRGVKVAGQRRRLVVNKKTGTAAFRLFNVYREVDVKNAGRGSGLREGIKQSLKTRVTLTEKRTAISVRTTNARKTGATFWQSRRFRHPAWGDRERMYDQAGQPYFWGPAFRGAERMAGRVSAAIDDALRQIADKT
ncbi:MAG: hypothetical protein J0I33_00125 [Microbacterium ginsengisoli]|mgnify:CR=1 FL=1|uniref:hypothetical protein n=1 Tax=Microbacterium TaxID=33882 RepID=UPI0006FC5691|nr:MULTISPECIES: hypothetical protein [unclassified Microbacterium]KQR91287.1 hypothetical protein ASF93_08040 [Microbacterium sp. Leaf347]KQS01275.1 hypothetical protein ASG00_10870 [Microbacterium sp. Leaf351]MBN9197039.1 hypothetical protein [Microbacterium ginsengisoli]OJU76997.1 MAG: hypothetical protein BGO15_05695 [Microbacterium sp. 71-23]